MREATTKKNSQAQNLAIFLGGEGGIRTHGTLSGTTVFKTVSLNRSDTSPRLKILYHICYKVVCPSHIKMLYYLHMQPKTQQPAGEQEGFYRPSQESPYQENPDTGVLPQAPAFDESQTVSWEASEYIHRSKDFSWKIIFGIVVLIGVGLAIWAQAWTFAALVVAMGIAMGVFAFRQPKVKRYTLTHEHLQIDEHTYPLAEFRSFGVLAEDAFYSIMLIPTKRFMPAISVYFAQEDGEQIVDILSSHLPLEDIEPDIIDTIMRRLHF